MVLKRLEKNICKTLIKFIGIYQRFISPMFPDSCRFVPSCSAYSKLAFENFGILKGLYLSAWRILRCNPFCKGGEDPLPSMKQTANARE
ncbi:MAG: membrane protein insertion efficiency factor YidD [Candidatus Cloacimonetes bacterium]|nr:membrane protein insertion efficiency factor YidD [Candidatus Cloacimonadota bacterium]